MFSFRRLAHSFQEQFLTDVGSLVDLDVVKFDAEVGPTMFAVWTLSPDTQWQLEHGEGGRCHPLEQSQDPLHWRTVSKLDEGFHLCTG